MNPGIPETVRRLVHAHLPTMEHVDALVLLVGAAGEDRSSKEVAGDLHTEPESAAAVLRALVKAGFLRSQVDGGVERFRYVADPTLHPVVEELLEAHRTLPVSLVRLVYDRPSPDVAKEFADAFRIRKSTS